MQAIGLPDIKFDVGKFQWIGSISPLAGTISVASRSGATSIASARTQEFILGASGVGGDSFTMAAMFNAFAGTRFKIVTGYKGGNDINLAMERGELDGRYNFWTSWKATRPDWIQSGFLRQLAYIGPKLPDMPDVPSILDVLLDPNDAAAVSLIISGNQLGTPLAAPSGTPVRQMSELRNAFKMTMGDAGFRDEAARLKIEIDVVPWEVVKKVVDQALNSPRDVIDRARIVLPK